MFYIPHSEYGAFKLRRDTGNIKTPPDVPFIVDRNINVVSKALQYHTQKALSFQSSTGRGQLKASQVRATLGGCLVYLDGYYELPPDEEHNSPWWCPVDPIIEFWLLELGSERTKITGRCTQSIAAYYFQVLLANIKVWWPESSQQIDAYLKRLGAEGPAAEDKQAAPGGEAEEHEPWEAIKEARYRGWVRLWWLGYDKGEIADRDGKNVVTKTVQNVFNTLRNSYGSAVVPTKKERDRMLRQTKSG